MSEAWFDPYIFSIGPLQLRWYGVLMVIGLLTASGMLKSFSRSSFWPLSVNGTDRFVVLMLVTMLVGARLGYIFFFAPSHYAANPLEALAIWRGGLSFHGALGAMALVTWIYARKNDLKFFQLSDPLVVAGTPGIFFGSIGNFINGELYGRVTDSWVGVTFPGGGPFPRHPSQLYEAFFEGFVLFGLLYWSSRRQAYHGFTTALFLMGYAMISFVLEFFREPLLPSGQFFVYFTLRQLFAVLLLVLGLMTWKSAKTLKLSPSPN